MVELHYGKIFAQNKSVGTGAIFTVRIPLGNSHLNSDQLQAEFSNEIIVKNINESSIDNMIVVSADGCSHKKVRTKTDFKVLIVEDNDEISSYLEKDLSDAYKVYSASNGKEGYEKILEIMPDLVISDVMMTYMDGTTMSKKIKRNANINHISIILLMAKVSLDFSLLNFI